ncbi:MAG: patatin family protein [Clostridiales bacterium]|nr:patatin family protein [Clostridiales bacterium]
MYKSKLGIVDVGGGTRGIFGAGVLDRFMELGISADHFVGVSAGSANGASYIAGQRGRNYVFYTEYAFRKEYMSLENLLHTGSYLDLDYIYGTLSNEDGEYPLDYDAMMSNPCDFEIVATNAVTGRAMYFKKEEIQRNKYDFFKASSCVPGIDKPYYVGKIPCYDGGLADPIPYKRAFRAGCDKVIVILTKPRDTIRNSGKDRALAVVIAGDYPKAAETWIGRAELYNRSVEEVFELERQGKILVIAPEDIGGLKTLSQDRAALDDLYQQGLKAADAAVDFLGEE